MPQISFDTAQDDVLAAQAVLAKAVSLRRALRRSQKPDDPRRISRIEAVLEQIDRAMKPVRSHAGRRAWEAYPDDVSVALAEVSAGLQYERRQLKKMRRSLPT